MRVSSITASEVVGTLRFDSKYHLSRQSPLIISLRRGGWPMATIAETFGAENIWTGNIFARVYAKSEDHGKPLLVPYDLFRYLPWSDKILSRSQVSQFERLEIKRGWMFIVCSGRNLGPTTIADKFCERFTMSHDMVRISVELSDDLFYLAAFLTTAHGQASIRTDMNGSVIDHTDAKQVAALSYPLVEDQLRNRCARRFREAFEKREQARLLLERTQVAFLKHFHLDVESSAGTPWPRRFHVARSSIVDRFDAEPHAPRYKAIRESIAATGGLPLADIATVMRPPSRYRTNYVDNPAFGVKLMNGRQISQYRAIALRAMSLSAFKDPDAFRLKEGTTLVTADGRAEENLADCALVASDRAGWGASGHIHRVLPRPGVHPGLVYLACSCAPVQAQFKALATGSVVDGLSEHEICSVYVPYSDSAAARKLGDEAQLAWKLFAEASLAEDAATSELESTLNQ